MPTVSICSAASSGISISNSSSKAITNSTTSRESAFRSLAKLASGVTVPGSSTSNCSTTTFLTRSKISALMDVNFYPLVYQTLAPRVWGNGAVLPFPAINFG
uniref:Uncharacterized protein n=1 Tax=Microcystis aeruginosa (strain PCC 7806) TaxID=267872 RepID=A8YNI5_MICA7|nr:unnamed protein product [Microcystis aeruginosa PCC 7806]